MITRAEDYCLITPIGVINGGILPARDVAGNGAASALRAEDLCFALEAVKERHISNSAAGTLPSPSHVKDRSDLTLIWDELLNCAYTYRVPVVSLSETFPDIGYVREDKGFDLWDWYPGAMQDSCRSALSSVLDNDYLRRFYYDLLRAERLLIMANGESYGLGSWTASGTYVDNVGNQYTISANGSGGINYGRLPAELNCIQYKYSSGIYNRYFYGVREVSMSHVLPLADRVQSAWHIVCYELNVISTGSTDNNYYYFVRAYPCSVTAAGIVANGGAFLPDYDIVSECETLGYSFPTQITGHDTPYASLRILRSWLVVDYNFRTEIRSLNWQWTP